MMCLLVGMDSMVRLVRGSGFMLKHFLRRSSRSAASQNVSLAGKTDWYQRLWSLTQTTTDNEKKAGLVPISISYITVGGTHVAAIMSNLANVQANYRKE